MIYFSNLFMKYEKIHWWSYEKTDENICQYNKKSKK